MRPFDPARAQGTFVAVAVATPPGLSALALDHRGVAWTVPERDRFVIELAIPPGDAPAVIGVKQYPIVGLRDDVDTEALAWLDETTLAFGIEGQDDAHASVALARREGGTFVVQKTIDLTNLGVTMKHNHGAEGLCGSTGDYLVAIEEAGTLPDRSRYAPLVRIRGEQQTIYKLRLATATGKISALDCTSPTEVLAIERHYGVSRIVRFAVPEDPATPLEGAIVLDLGGILDGSLNLEGIARLPDGRMLAIADNQGLSTSGPSYVLIFPAR